MSKKHATYESLGDTIFYRPRIIHLTCHGKYTEENNTSTLNFENHNILGLLDDISNQRFNDLLSGLNSTKVELVFISACMSQQIGEIFKEKLKKAVVIAINKSLPVKDKASILFAQNFYDALLKGCTIIEAFNEAKKYLRSSDQRTLACCCHHTKIHQNDCRWKNAFALTKKHYTDIL